MNNNATFSVNNSVKNSISAQKVQKQGYKAVERVFNEEFQNYLDGVFYDHKPLSADKERALIAKAKEGDMKALNTLAVHNIGFIVEQVSHFCHRGVPAEDLLQAGYIGFLKAIEKFDLSHNVKLDTFAKMSIINDIKTEISNNGSTVKIPNLYKVLQIKKDLLKAEQRYIQEFGCFPIDIESLIDYTDLDIKEILTYIDKCIGFTSLDDCYASGEEVDAGYYADKLIYGSNYSEMTFGVGEDDIYCQEIFERVYKTTKFTKQEQKVMDLRFGRVEGYPSCEPEEIQEILGLGKEAVRVHLKHGFKKLLSNPEMREFAA